MTNFEKISSKNPSKYAVVNFTQGAQALVLKSTRTVIEGNAPFWSNWVLFKRQGLLTAQKGRKSAYDNPTLFAV